jgi:hypothetical protein
VAADRRAYEEVIDLFARGTSSAMCSLFVRPRNLRACALSARTGPAIDRDEVAELERFGELRAANAVGGRPACTFRYGRQPNRLRKCARPSQHLF